MVHRTEASHWPNGYSWPTRRNWAAIKDQTTAGTTPETNPTTVLVRPSQITGNRRRIKPMKPTSSMEVPIAARPDMRWPKVMYELKRTDAITTNWSKPNMVPNQICPCFHWCASSSASNFSNSLWTLFCLWELIPTAWLLSHMSKTAVYLPERMMIIPIFAIIVDLAGIYGGICLLLGVKLGRPIIRVVAAAVAIIIVVNLADFRSRGPAWSILFVSGFLVVFCLTTIWLFRSPRKPKLATK